MACIACLNNPPRGTADIFNVGSGFGYSINEICTKIETITSTPITRQYQAARTVDIKNITLSYENLHQSTNWTPQVTLHNGLNKMWAWFNNPYYIHSNVSKKYLNFTKINYHGIH